MTALSGLCDFDGILHNTELLARQIIINGSLEWNSKQA
jgi:hypothetical protein